MMRLAEDCGQQQQCADHAPSNALLKLVMRDNWQLAKEPSFLVSKDLWCSQFEGFLGVMQQSLASVAHLSTMLQQHYTFVTDALSSIQNFRKVDAARLIQCFDSWFHQKWFDVHSNPRTAPSTHVTFSTYERWFALVPFSEVNLSAPASWVSGSRDQSAGIHPDHLSSLLRFKLAAHDLQVCAGRWQGQSRAQRTCSRCSLQVVEDEFHMVFECPYYDTIRARFSELFSSFGGWDRCGKNAQPVGSDLVSFMHQKPRLVAAFVHACWLKRCSPVVTQIMMPEVETALDRSEDFWSLDSEVWLDCEDESFDSLQSP